MSDRKPFRLLRKWRDEGPDPLVHCEYEASFWEGPEEPGEVGRFVRRRCADLWFPKKQRFLNTAPSVSYYDALRKAVA